MNDGKSDKSGAVLKDLVGGYYDAGDAIKFHFPKAFAMTMLSWSVIEYSAKYEAAGELSHVKDIIKWGTDYFLKTFNSSADTINQIVAQVHNLTCFHFKSFDFFSHVKDIILNLSTFSSSIKFNQIVA